MFDENGNAIETLETTVHGFDSDSGEFISSYDIRIIAGTGIPGLSTLTAPPKDKAGYARICQDGGWTYARDLRGQTIYATATAQAQQITRLGEVPDGYVTDAPATPYDAWNGKKWVTDTDAQKSAQVVQLEALRTSLLSKADDIMRDWRDELSLGVISDDDKAKLLNWLDYKKRVKAVDISLGESIIWPEEPADVA
ncbi:tail fiber assembly protein [Pseudomonas graminis]